MSAVALMVLSLVGPAHGVEYATPQDEADWQYRKTHGHFNVVWMHGLAEDYHSGRITQADLLREMLVERPVLTPQLLAYHAGGNFDCVLTDAMFAESNGPIGQDANGQNVYFDTTQYLDPSGNVLSQYARDYNTAVRANSILREAEENWATQGCVQRGPPVTNTCCKCDPLCDCDTASTGARCEIDGFGNCVHGSHMCLVAP